MGVCITPQGCLSAATDGVWGSLTGGITTAAGEMVTQLFAWWTTTGSASVDTAVLRTAQSYVITWVGIPIAVLATLAAVAWGVAGASHTWLRDIVRGLLIFGITTVGSIPIVRVLQEWADSLSNGLLAGVPTKDVGSRFSSLLVLPVTAPAQVAFWGLVVMLVSAVQYVLMLFRDGAVLVLTVMLPVAAAGQFSRGSSTWLPKVAGWLFAFIFFKPAAALVYYLGLSLVGEGQGVQALVTGLAVMVAALFALPAMLRLVTFAAAAAPMNSNALGVLSTGTGLAAGGAQLAASRRPPEVSAAPRGAAATGIGRTSGGGLSMAATAAASGPVAAAAAPAAAAVDAAKTVQDAAAGTIEIWRD